MGNAEIPADFSARVLAWTGTDAGAVVESKLRSLRRLILLTLACESWVALRYVPYSSDPGLYGLLAAALTAAAALGWRDRFARPAIGIAAYRRHFYSAS